MRAKRIVSWLAATTLITGLLVTAGPPASAAPDPADLARGKPVSVSSSTAQRTAGQRRRPRHLLAELGRRRAAGHGRPPQPRPPRPGGAEAARQVVGPHPGARRADQRRRRHLRHRGRRGRAHLRPRGRQRRHHPARRGRRPLRAGRLRQRRQAVHRAARRAAGVRRRGVHRRPDRRPPGDREQRDRRVPGRQRQRRQRGDLLGEQQQRLPPMDPGRPRRVGRHQPGRGEAAGELARAHPDPDRAAQHRRHELHRPRREHRLPVQPGRRQHGDDHLRRRPPPGTCGCTSPRTPAGPPRRSPSSRSTAPPAATPRRRPRRPASRSPSRRPARSG